MISSSICLLFIYVFTIGYVFGGGPRVITRLGTLEGVSQYKGAYEASEKLADAYLNVPYGLDTSGRRRFAPPEPVTQHINSTLHVKEPAPTCWNYLDTAFGDFYGSTMWNPKTPLTENCLNMNIWVPETAKRNKAGNTVIVWIYGGGFFSGSPSLELYNGSMIAYETGAIVVNINYRLGPFGFLYLNTTDAPGNVGLLDQQLALKWVNQNIQAFGGDPQKVTIVGESAGAASVSAHLLSPGSKGLFHNAILQSGCITNPWALTTKEDLLKRSQLLVQEVNCNMRSSSGVMSCLQSKSSKQIQSAADKIMGAAGMMGLPFVPVDNDGVFFTQPVRHMLRTGEGVSKVPVLIGTNKDEATYWLPYYLPTHFPFNPKAKQGVNAEENQGLIDWNEYLTAVNKTLVGAMSPVARKALAMQYLLTSGGEMSEENLRNRFSLLFGDYFFTCDVLSCAQQFAQHNDMPVHAYYFAQSSSTNPWPSWMGAMHGYEIEYIFGDPLRAKFDGKYTQKEKAFSRTMMQAWFQFAKSSDPSPALRRRQWPRYRNETRRYVHLDANTQQVKEALNDDNCAVLKSAKEKHTCIRPSITSGSTTITMSLFVVLLSRIFDVLF